MELNSMTSCLKLAAEAKATGTAYGLLRMTQIMLLMLSVPPASTRLGADLARRNVEKQACLFSHQKAKFIKKPNTGLLPLEIAVEGNEIDRLDM